MISASDLRGDFNALFYDGLPGWCPPGMLGYMRPRVRPGYHTAERRLIALKWAKQALYGR